MVALEAWFRTGGNFEYDETPPIATSRPPLVAFVDGHRRGYCQHFAGAMALMLRYLGVPARVGAGFGTGRFDPKTGEWTVSDTNAHTWVEVWFKGYGWLPFDPTPGRGRLRGVVLLVLALLRRRRRDERLRRRRLGARAGAPPLAGSRERDGAAGPRARRRPGWRSYGRRSRPSERRRLVGRAGA